jgi:hypothetical protein
MRHIAIYCTMLSTAHCYLLHIAIYYTLLSTAHCYLLHIYMVYSQRSDKFQHQNKEKSSYQHTSANISFQGTIPIFTWSHSFRLLSVETLKTLVCSGPIENEGYFTNTFLCLSDYSQLPHLWKGAKGHDQTWPCMHLLSYGTFRAFIVKCDLMHNKNPTVNKLVIWARFSIITNKCT